MQTTLSQTEAAANNPGLKQLITLRWLALAGQIGLCLFARYYLDMLLPWGVLIPCMVATAATNIVASFCKGKNFRQDKILCGILLFMDTTILTLMLFWTGGAHNPFATFYLLHVAIASILLSHRTAWAMVFFASVCYALLFLSPHTLTTLSAHEFCGSLDFHLQGMLLSMILVGMGIVFFSGQLKTKLARKEAELKLAQLNAARNERFASLATLAAGVAHELATPLGTIAIISEDMAEQAGSSCHSKDCLSDANLIRSEVQRCCEVIEKLRRQTTADSGDPIQNLHIADIPELLKPYLKPEHLQRLRFENHCSAPTVCVPQTALLQSLGVLVKNACQSDGSSQPVSLRVKEQSGDLLFIIEDHGGGMPPETLARLGEPFFTTKEPGRGMGLGLFLVRMFVERVNGSLDIDSAPGTGTTIVLTIPAHEDTAH